MSDTLGGWTERQRTDAMRELTEELREFSHDGLTLLARDLRAGDVVRGSWAGCVLSYRRGVRGSTRRDRDGQARNAFTRLWDSGTLTDEEVLAAVVRELERRRGGVRPPSAEPVGAVSRSRG